MFIHVIKSVIKLADKNLWNVRIIIKLYLEICFNFIMSIIKSNYKILIYKLLVPRIIILFIFKEILRRERIKHYHHAFVAFNFNYFKILQDLESGHWEKCGLFSSQFLLADQQVHNLSWF